MNGGIVTKIVALSLILSGLAACANKKDDSTKTQAVGLETKIGAQLTANTWCSANRTDDQGLVTFDKYIFRKSGDLQVREMQLQNTVTLKTLSTDNGTWAVTSDEIFLAREQSSLHAKIVSTSRPSDSAKCVNLTTSESTQQLCDCQM